MGVRGAALAALSIVVVAAVVGGYTYLRNAVTTGNPFYPQPVTVGGVELFPGRPEMSLAARQGGQESQLDLYEFLVGPDNPFVSFFPFTLLPAALLAPLVAAWRRRWIAAAVLAMPAVFFLEFVYLTWDHRDIRYFLAGVALAALAFAWLTERLGTVGSWVRLAMMATLVLRFLRFAGARGTRENITAALLVGAVALLLPLARRQGPWLRGAWPWLAGAASVAVALALGANLERYHRSKLADVPAAVALERQVGERGATVGYVGLNQPYLFFGSHLQNDVHVVPRSWNLRAEHYRWGAPADPPFPPSRYRRWMGVMETLGVEYVVVFRSPDENPERRWMANHWERFRRTYADETMEVWKVGPRPAADRGDGAEDDRP
jgi:hypothetical protein